MKILHTIILPNGKAHTRNSKRPTRFAVMLTHSAEYIAEMRECMPAAILRAHERGEWTGGIEGWSNVRSNAERTAANLSKRYGCPCTVIDTGADFTVDLTM